MPAPNDTAYDATETVFCLVTCQISNLCHEFRDPAMDSFSTTGSMICLLYMILIAFSASSTTTTGAQRSAIFFPPRSQPLLCVCSPPLLESEACPCCAGFPLRAPAWAFLRLLL